MSAVAVAPLRAEWTTPQVLRAGLVAVCVSAAILMGTALTGARSLRHSLQVVGRDTAPSIIAAQHIRAALADMDADGAAELLSKDRARASFEKFEEHRKEAVDALIVAARNITYATEQKPIETMAMDIGTYTAAMQKARDQHDAGDRNWIDSYRAAEQIMEKTLLPAATELDGANHTELVAADAERQSTSNKAALALTLAGALTGGLLVLLQMYLTQRVRRVLNPLLICATIVTFLFTVHSVNAFRAESEDLKVAVKDAFASIYVLATARSEAYSAHAFESRSLLDTARAAEYQKSFQEKVGRIENFYLAQELKNITFEGEREAATETLSSFQLYVDLEKQNRDRSGEAFNKFDAALGRTLELNRTAFTRAVDKGFADVSGFDALAPCTALAIALLTFLGLRPRMREYYL